MPSVIKSVSFDAADALALAKFWAAVFGSDVDEDSTPEKAFVEAAGWGRAEYLVQQGPRVQGREEPNAFRPAGSRPGCRRGVAARKARGHRGWQPPQPRGDARSGRQRVLRRTRSSIARPRRLVDAHEHPPGSSHSRAGGRLVCLLPTRIVLPYLTDLAHLNDHRAVQLGMIAHKRRQATARSRCRGGR
jgi:hypothetical protein